MKRIFLFCLVLVWSAQSLIAAEASWQPTRWNGEEALQSTLGPWRAIVSIERARLVSFGRADSAENLLFFAATREDPAGWGGHRLWLGPQIKWSAIWPPPAAWEHARPEAVMIDGGTLRLVLRDAGDGWPRLTRTYRWSEQGLVCGAETHGGTRPAQVIQIFQVPGTDRVRMLTPADAALPHGYVRLPFGPLHSLVTEFVPTPHVEPATGLVWLHRTGVSEKLGFRPQALTAFAGAAPVLEVRRVGQTGRIESELDQGFCTQVYLGGGEPFIELEQLSPQFAAGADAVFEIEIAAPR